MSWISSLFLIVGFILLLLGILKTVKNSQMVAIFGLVLVVIGGLGYSNIIDFSKLSLSQPFTSAPQYVPVQQNIPQPSSPCSANAITSNGKSQADVLIRNVENASLGYIGGTVSANVNGAFIDSVSANAGSSASYASMSNIPNCGTGELVVTLTTGTGLASSKKVRDVEKNQIVSGYDFTDKAVHKYEILSSSTDVINIQARDSALAVSSNGQVNGSQEAGSGGAYAVSGTGTADGTAYFTNTSLAAKGSINGYIDFKVNGSTTVTGQYDEPDGIVISYDTATASVFSPNSLTLAIDQPAGFSLNKVTNNAGGCGLSDVLNNRNVEACWTAPTLKAGVLYRVRFTLTADLGDPLVSGASPKICFDDRVSFRDTDGSIKYQSFSTSGTNQGVGGTCLQMVLN